MTIDENKRLRLMFLTRVVRKEIHYLAETDQRLFNNKPLTLEIINRMESEPELAERVDAFVSRFGRLQDTLGDKLLPLLLTTLGEKTATVIDNLDRAEKLAWIKSADDWMTMRALRNQMVHEYIEDPCILCSSLQSGHEFVSDLIITANTLLQEITQRGWLR